MSIRILKFIALVPLALLCLFLLAKRNVPLITGRTVVATATTPITPPWQDKLVTVHAGSTNVFTMWQDFFDFPIFLYAFGDSQRFLCVYDNDTAVVVFVVDCRTVGTNSPTSPLWPPDDYTRGVLQQMATNIVVQATGPVRLPTYEEVREASSNVLAVSSSRFKTASFPTLDVGLWRYYLPKQWVLMALDSNRSNCWPTK